MGNSHGGKREGSGRKPNSNGITQSVKNLFTGEAEKAAQNIINISRNNDHPQQLKALEIILARSVGQAPTVKEKAMMDYLDGTINAMQCALMIEASGGNVNRYFRDYLHAEKNEAEIKYRDNREAGDTGMMKIHNETQTDFTVKDDNAPPWKDD